MRKTTFAIRATKTLVHAEPSAPKADALPRLAVVSCDNAPVCRSKPD